MGELNPVPMRINKVEGAAGQVKLSGGPGVLESWGAPAPAAHVHDAADVTTGQIPLARLVDAVCSETEAATLIAAAVKSIATGNYTGNQGAGRQITTGFKCSNVVIFDVTAPHELKCWFLIPGATRDMGGGDDTANCYVHASDGFVVGGDVGNSDTVSYYYWAISE